jgi:septal ring factor EnvC (AmiA/AmiB activator)
MMSRRLRTLVLVVVLSTCVQPAFAQHGAGGFASVDEEIAQTMATIERARAQKDRVDAEIEGLAERRTAAQRRLRTRTRALYRISRAGMLPLAGGFPALLSHLSRVDRLERMVTSDARGLSSLAERGHALRVETGQLAADLATAEARLQELDGQKSRLDQLAMRTDFWDRGFAAADPGQGSQPMGWGSLSLSDGAMDPSFTAQRGRLGMPVAGRVDVRPADRGDGPGVEVFASHGAVVRAVDEGRVAYVDRHPGYGPMVIVDHGDSYFTVYGGLAATNIRVGDPVPRGASLGAVGSEAIFFQVRRGTRALDASAWLGL